MAKYRSLLKQGATFKFQGYGEYYVPANQIIDTAEIPLKVLVAIQRRTSVKVFEPVDTGESNIVEKKEDLTPPPTLKDIDTDKEVEETLEDKTIDDIRLMCDEQGVKYSRSNNKAQLIAKLQEVEDDGEHE